MHNFIVSIALMPSSNSAFIVPFCEQQHEVIFADEHLLIVNKPNGLLSVPGRLAENKDCLISRVQQQYPTASMVHRLDCDTSGVMVIALHKDCHVALSRLFEQRKTQKSYTAIVYGQLEQTQGQIELPIICDWPNRPKQKICFDDGKKALTYYDVIHYDAAANTSRVKLTPFTGRSHQLRIHMAEIGHPILGDDMYAHAKAYKMNKRMCLHSTHLAFTHPFTHKELNFTIEPEF